MSATFLDQFLARKRLEVAGRRAALPENELAARAAGAPPSRSFEAGLSSQGGPVRVIAEVKRASPSAGGIDARLNAPAQARRYAQGGAAAISVLTDGPGFGGSLDDLRAVRSAVEVPVLRKDFVLYRYQLLEAREAGADAALLIVAALPQGELLRLLADCEELGLAALVEVHDEGEAEIALRAGARLVGVNNRNLHTFQVDLTTSERILPALPRGVKGVAESGVRTLADATRLRRAGAANLLVGEALVRDADPARLLAELTAPLPPEPEVP
jgi:indole-3-glycerol phosphate synthase